MDEETDHSRHDEAMTEEARPAMQHEHEEPSPTETFIKLSKTTSGSQVCFEIARL
jgi:hypothetical protein